jgi:ankyrin repeat protein/catechol 2,3-dioxygenase-like lactoylglutathione lyase family enzyme
MTTPNLPNRPSLEYLKKLAKQRLLAMRRTDPRATLASAQLEVARDHGFPSWRALKKHVDDMRAPAIASFKAACETDDASTLRNLLRDDPSLARMRIENQTTGLHLALHNADAVRVLLEHGADPNARDEGDNALPLHFAAGGGYLESVRSLLEAGSDVHGKGDLHELEVIGWATIWREINRAIVDLLIEHGAKHHIFSAIALGDIDLVRRVAGEEPNAIHRKLSKFEGKQSALHYVIAPPDGLVGGTFRTGDHYRTLDLLIELGADLEAKDAKGRTPLALAMLRGDQEAMRRLHAAGARPPAHEKTKRTPSLAELARSMTNLRPMLCVRDMAETIAWYQAIGFELAGSHGEGGVLDWASLCFGKTEIMLVPSATPTSSLSLWINTDRIDDLYAVLKQRQLERAQAVLDGETVEGPEVKFTQDLYTAFYGQREFCLRDPNGVDINFAQSL